MIDDRKVPSGNLKSPGLHTSLDKPSEIAALAAMDEQERQKIVDRAVAGEKVSAAKIQREANTEAPTTSDGTGKARSKPSRRKNADLAPTLDPRTWSTSTPQERQAFVKAVGRSEIEDALNAIESGRGRSQPQDEVAKLKRAFERLQRALSGASEPARKTFVEHCREEILALANAPEPPNPELPNPEPPNPEAPSPAEVESSTVPPARARAYGVAETVIMPGKQEGKPITQGLQPAKARENYPFKDPAKRGKGRPLGSVNRYTGALKELFLQAADEVGDRTEIGPNGELDGDGGALAFLKVTALTERKTFFTAMARLLPITIKTAPPLKKVLTREEALHELKARGLDPELINHLRRLPFPEEEKSKLDEIYPPIVDLDENEYEGDKQKEEEK